MSEEIHNRKIHEYRAAAAACIKWAESKGISKATRQRWLKLAQEWIEFAEEAEQKLRADSPDGTEADGPEAAA